MWSSISNTHFDVSGCLTLVQVMDGMKLFFLANGKDGIGRDGTFDNRTLKWECVPLRKGDLL